MMTSSHYLSKTLFFLENLRNKKTRKLKQWIYFGRYALGSDHQWHREDKCIWRYCFHYPHMCHCWHRDILNRGLNLRNNNKSEKATHETKNYCSKQQNPSCGTKNFVSIKIFISREGLGFSEEALVSFSFLRVCPDTHWYLKWWLWMFIRKLF